MNAYVCGDRATRCECELDVFVSASIRQSAGVGSLLDAIACIVEDCYHHMSVWWIG